MAARTELDHNHPLFLHPSDTTRAPIISIQLTGSDNYTTWSRAMEIQLLVYAKNARVVREDLRERFDKDEFDNMVPPPCDCARSKNFIEFMQKQKVLQFLMGLNEIYEQARSQILMTSPTPSINKAYSMLVERESHMTVANTMTAGDGNEHAALLAGKYYAYQNYHIPKRN
ncbi:uncharacterized protein LOC107770218 [Nicotiana tabacum]|uniref:Uncharacterized protein LOC107770218 n=1 Tax=Nicotiana tabacum TaxID=4097 RepID=A0A1S3XZ54_TOBAC|nr:PREDICTED: uncharacterized protein LOC107770218 [Nicotiana tabacum]